MQLISFLEKMAEALVEFNKRYPAIKHKKYKGIEDFVLQEGKPFTGGVADIKNYKVRHRKVKGCFFNAQQLAKGYDNLIYCEGFIYMYNGYPDFPFLHAWCFDINTGKVVEPTLKNVDDETEYFGIKFNKDYMFEITRGRGKEIISLIDNPEMNYPLLRGTHENYSVTYLAEEL